MRRHRRQKGYVWKESGWWYGRWREDVLVNGEIKRKQRCKQLAPVSDCYRSKKDVRPLLDEILLPINAGRTDARSTMSLTEFVDGYYLPHVKDDCKPSTYHGYHKLWRKQLGPRLAGKVLRDFRTADAANLLTKLCSDGLGRRSLHHAKSLLSGVFKYAKNLGVLDGLNPVQDAEIPKRATPPRETHAASPDEVVSMLTSLTDVRARAAVALVFFAGLRPGEARGVKWDDYDETRQQLVVRESVWHTYTTTPKTECSLKPIPVIEPLRSALSQLRASYSGALTGTILQGPSGKPLNLDNLARRVVRPQLKRAEVTWCGWYSLRRGIATILKSLTKDPLAARGLLRHSSVSTTLTHYIKDVPEETLRGMRLVEELFSSCAEGTVTQNRQVQ